MNTVQEIESHAKQKMDKAVADLLLAVQGLRTGRANVSLLDGIKVDYYGTPTPLREVSQLHAPEPALITVQPWESNLIAPIEKAIRLAELGLNPQNDGKTIRLPIPPLTTERRKEFVKKLHEMGEQHRVSIRNLRRDANDHLKKLLKDKSISEDDERRSMDSIQKLTDVFMKRVDEAVAKKEQEMMQI